MSKKVLIVDDDPETRIILSDFLTRLNVNHSTVASAAECLARLVSEPTKYCLVLMDIHMPSLSGVDARTWIKDSEIDPPRGIPIIALTADENYHDEDRIARFGMQGALSKPVTLERLRDTLRKYGSIAQFS